MDRVQTPGADLARLHADALTDGRRPVAGALILDDRGRVFVQRAALRSVPAPAFPHVTLFLGGDVAEPIEAIRRRWDPAMASQIGAHVTVACPEEIGSVEEMADRVRRAAEGIGPFELRLGSAFRRQDVHPWVGLQVDDPEGGWRRLRELIVPSAARMRKIEPHMTLVHPRHSNLGDRAWVALTGWPAPTGMTRAGEVAITAFDGRAWRVLEQVPLGTPAPSGRELAQEVRETDAT